MELNMGGGKDERIWMKMDCPIGETWLDRVGGMVKYEVIQPIKKIKYGTPGQGGDADADMNLTNGGRVVERVYVDMHKNEIYIDDEKEFMGFMPEDRGVANLFNKSFQCHLLPTAFRPVCPTVFVSI